MTILRLKVYRIETPVARQTQVLRELSASLTDANSDGLESRFNWTVEGFYDRNSVYASLPFGRCFENRAADRETISREI